jgi:hypothetical protein
MMGTSQRPSSEIGMAQTTTAEMADADEALTSSPFALMLPDLARKIVARAAASKVPGRFCSPLSNPKLPGATGDDDD